MILAVDIGNTYIVLGAVDGQCKVVQTMQMKTDPNETAYEYAVKMKQILPLAGIDAGCFDGAIVSS
ncbi:MAG: type III pantothenate kinase, partial [Firmicutes bacterium]|nr:type III pantothenate kinase [Bacillota bacterium]